MSFLPTHLNKYAPLGSSLYYSLLTAPVNDRLHLLQLRGIIKEFMQLVYLDATPAAAKIAWWQDQLLAKHSDHPLLSVHIPRQAKEVLLAILVAFSQDLSIPIYTTQVDLNNFYQQTAGALEALLLSIYLPTFTADKASICLTYFGIFIQQVAHLRQLRNLLAQQHPYLAGDILIEHNVTLAQLVQWQTTPAIQTLLQQQSNLAYANLHNGWLLLDKRWREAFRPTLSLVNMYTALLDEIVRADFSVLQEKLHLTPLRKWWISWRT